jgi:hypothetical protein
MTRRPTLAVLAASAIALQAGVPAAGQSPSPADPPDRSNPAPPPNAAPTVNLLGLEADPLEEAIVTDRPDFTESALAVPRGHAQLEGGYTFTYDSGDGVRRSEHVYPEFLLRVGLVREWELRVAWDGWIHGEEVFREANDAGRRVVVTDRADGAGDMSLGVKRHLWDQDGLRPDFGLIVEADLPTGGRDQTSGDVDPGMKLLWGYDLTDSLGLAGNVNCAVPTSGNERFFQVSASISLAVSLTDRLGFYTEYFGFYPADFDNSDAHVANGGFTYLITDNLQLDVRAGVGLNDEADDFFAGAGFAVRF